MKKAGNGMVYFYGSMLALVALSTLTLAYSFVELADEYLKISGI